jgi:hypothetical protein
MSRSARGHISTSRIVFNVGSGLFRPLYRDFEYDERLAVDNNCGGDQRYNLQGRFEKPELWKLPRQRISVTNLCSIEDVTVDSLDAQTKVTWKLQGAWDKDPEATVSIYLQKVRGRRARDVATLAEGLKPGARSATVDLSKYHDGPYRITLRKDGDNETGGCSANF